MLTKTIHRFIHSLLLIVVSLQITPASTSAHPSTELANQSIPIECVIYAVDHDTQNGTELFTVDLQSEKIATVEGLPNYEVEGLAVHPSTHNLYATAHEQGAAESQLFIIDPRAGTMMLIGNTGFSALTDLSFRPSDETLWGWVSDVGLIQVDLATGAGTNSYESQREVDSMTWSNNGLLLYLGKDKELWTFEPNSSSLQKIGDNLHGKATALETRPDGLLLGAFGKEYTTNFFIYDANEAHVVRTISISDNRYDPDDIAWPPVCGNISSGGYADIIKEVSVEKSQVCAGEDFLVTVQAEHPETADGSVTISINGKWGHEQYIQFDGAPGPRFVEVVATTPEKHIDNREVEIEVVECDTSHTFPIIHIQPNLYHDFTVDFEVINSSKFEGQNPTFIWDFGDGSTTQTAAPFTSHYFGDSITSEQEYIVFQASLTLQRPDQPDISVHKTVTLWNLYTFNRQRGFVQLPVISDGLIDRVNNNFVGAYRLKNLEAQEVTLASRRLEYQPCNPDAGSIIAEPEDQNVTVGPLQELEQQIELPIETIAASICGLLIHLEGHTADQIQVKASTYFELNTNKSMTEQVSDPALNFLLNSLVEQGLVANPELITDEELYQLAREGRIAYPLQTAESSDANPALASQLDNPSGVIGEPCIHGDTPPRVGVSCQVTNEWGYVPAYIANAKKGDILLTAACGMIGQMFRKLSPPQRYTHEGLMTQDRYEVRHSTAIQERFEDYTVGLAGSSGIRPDILKYSWPGPITQKIYKAFEGEYFTDPESGQLYPNTGFSHSVRCPGDTDIVPPLVLKPPLKDEQTIRPILHAAAEAGKAINGHYRVAAYSDGAMAFNPVSNGPSDSGWAAGTRATVSTVFVWAALKDAGVPLENGYDIEQDLREIALGGDLSCNPMDGLYCYDEAERRAAGEVIYETIYNKAKSAAGWFGDWLTGAGHKFAQQTANCFAFDLCDTVAPPPITPSNWNKWKNPGTGKSVSPDNFMLWDAPPGGVYGYWTPMNYVMGKYQRLYKWLPSDGSGNVLVKVSYEGVPTQDATVLLAGFTLLTNAEGEALFEAIPAGRYEVKAMKEVAPGEVASDILDVEVIAQQTVNVELIINFELPPQPTVVVRVVVEALHGYGCLGEDMGFLGCWNPEDGLDFYTITKIDEAIVNTREQTVEGDPYGDDWFYPDWDLSSQVDSSRGNIPIEIKMMDKDEGLRGDDDHVDIFTQKGRTLNMLLDLNTCTISGGVSGQCGSPIYSEGGEDGDEDLAQIWFRIEVDIAANNELRTTTTTMGSSGGSLASSDHNLNIEFPENAFLQPVTVSYQRIDSALENLDAEMTVVHAFTLDAKTEDGVPVSQFSQPYTLTVHYQDEQLSALELTESNLNIAHWDGNAWVPALPCLSCNVNTDGNSVTIMLDHFTKFALIGQVQDQSREHEMFLPLIRQ